VSVEVRDAITLALLHMIVPSAKSVLDIACASGSLGRASGAERYTYVGTDISQYAIEQARQRSPERVFHCVDLKNFVPEQQFDAICFNEVLYFLTPEESVKQLKRYALYLLDGGVFVLGMKNDPKSSAIFRLVGKSFDWINGILYQEKKQGYSYSIKANAERPGYLLGVFASNRNH
jgi:SAM-dependent methyltransferase